MAPISCCILGCGPIVSISNFTNISGSRHRTSKFSHLVGHCISQGLSSQVSQTKLRCRCWRRSKQKKSCSLRSHRSSRIMLQILFGRSSMTECSLFVVTAQIHYIRAHRILMVFPLLHSLAQDALLHHALPTSVVLYLLLLGIDIELIALLAVIKVYQF